MSRELPISLNSARKAANWLMTHFGGSIRAASGGTPFDPALICGIACQETAYFWLPLITKAGSTITADEVIARCVLDASGDAAGASRSAFPRNTAAFYAKYDRALGDMLVSKRTRRVPSAAWDPRSGSTRAMASSNTTCNLWRMTKATSASGSGTISKSACAGS